MIIELLWWLGWAWCAAWAAAPLVAVGIAGPVAGVVIWALAAPWSALAGMTLLRLLLPRARPGTFRLPPADGSLRWALAGWPASTYLTLFQPLFFNCPGFQRLALRAFGARLGAGAWITSRTVVREPHLVEVGARTVVGEYAHLVCSYQPRPGLLVVDRIRIGADSLIGAYTHIGPGTEIAAGCILEHDTGLGGRVRVGHGTRIGAGTRIYNGARIGSGVRIGKHCLVSGGAVLEDGACLPDGTVFGGEPTPSEVAS